MAQILATTPDELDQALGAAVEVLRRGGLVAFPTETVYGLGADAGNELGVGRIFQAKRRPHGHPLIVHLPTLESLDQWATDIPIAARRVVSVCWPGPVTVILHRSSLVSPIVSGGLETVGLRIPSHPIALALLEQFGSAIAAPSANRFTHVSPTTAQHVMDDLGDDVDLILDSGPTPVGIESTIVDFSQDPPVLLRPGAYTLEELSQIAEVAITRSNIAGTMSPGRHAVHYAPNTAVIACRADRLLQCLADHSELPQRILVLAWQQQPDLPGNVTWWQWPDSLEQTGRILYSRLREIDEQGFDLAILELPSEMGIGAALADRLRRAAGSVEYGP
ncbi:MAG TPA: L-threonylcarbamoyladenylate synthase [Pirellulaceae bacterium]|nr:L-threonylcarbamoyladenylate synthase [Pirellulaceae bacterium]